MLDTLLDGIKGQVASTIAEKVGLDMGQAEQAVPVAGESIKEGILGAVSTGDVAGVLGMFQGDDMQSSSIFQSIAGIFTGKLGSLGIGGGSAISALALPMILNKIKGAASGDSGQLDAAGLMNVLGAGNTGGIMGAVTGALGGGGGGLLGNVMDAVTGGTEDAGDAAGDLKDQAIDAVKDKLGGLFGK